MDRVYNLVLYTCVWKFHNESYYFAQLITHNHKSKIILAVIVGKYGRKVDQGRERESS